MSLENMVHRSITGITQHTSALMLKEITLVEE